MDRHRIVRQELDVDFEARDPGGDALLHCFKGVRREAAGERGAVTTEHPAPAANRGRETSGQVSHGQIMMALESRGIATGPGLTPARHECLTEHVM